MFKVGNTTYRRSSKYGVGKEIGGKMYVHKDYVLTVVSSEEFAVAEACLPAGFTYNCCMIDRKARTIRFDEAPDFDTAREPHPGDFVEVNMKTLAIRRGHSEMIWHHKWMWVAEDYTGFDVAASYEWSKRWTQVVTHPSGSRRVWEKQIESLEGSEI